MRKHRRRKIDGPTALEIGVILLYVRTPTVTLNVVVPQSLNGPALYHDDYGSRCVDDELKDYHRIEEPSPRDVLLDDLDQEQRKRSAAETGAHDDERLFDEVILDGLNAPHWIKRY